MTRDSGYFIRDGFEVCATRQCPHCGLPYRPSRESLKRGKYCKTCGAHTCGLPGCHECVPFEKKMEESEKQQHHLILPTRYRR